MSFRYEICKRYSLSDVHPDGEFAVLDTALDGLRKITKGDPYTSWVLVQMDLSDRGRSGGRAVRAFGTMGSVVWAKTCKACKGIGIVKSCGSCGSLGAIPDGDDEVQTMRGA